MPSPAPIYNLQTHRVAVDRHFWSRLMRLPLRFAHRLEKCAWGRAACESCTGPPKKGICTGYWETLVSSTSSIQSHGEWEWE